MEQNSGAFKVIKIIDEYNIVVNAGAYCDIKEGDKMEIYIKGEDIIDPDTQENLGTLDIIKSKIIVKQVFQKFCVCGNNEVTTSTYLANFNSLFGNPPVPKKLNVDSYEITGGFKNDETKIKVGDLVRKSLS